MIQLGLLLLLAVALAALQILGGNTKDSCHWLAFAAVGLVGIFAMMAQNWGRGAEQDHRRRVPSSLCLFVALLATLYFLVRGCVSPDLYAARRDLLLVAGAFILYFVSATSLASRHSRWFLVFAIGGCLVAQVSWNWDQILDGIPGLYPPYDGINLLGLRGFVVPSHFCAFLEGASFLLLGAALLGRAHVLIKVAVAVLGIAGLVAAVMTRSRYGMLAIGVGGGVFLICTLFALWRIHRIHFWAAFTLAGIVLVVGGALLHGAVWETWKAEPAPTAMFREASGQSLVVRRELAIDQWRAAPVFGEGSATYHGFAERHRPPTVPQRDPTIHFAHSEYHQTLAEYGTVGLILLLTLIGVHLLNGFRFYHWQIFTRAPSTGRFTSTGLGLVCGAIAGLAAQLVHAWFGHHFHLPAVLLPSAIVLGILANPGMDLPLRNKAVVPASALFGLVRGGGSLLTGFLGALLVYGAWTCGRGEAALEESRSLSSETPSAVWQKVNAALRARSLDPRNPVALYQSALAYAEWAETVDPKFTPATLEQARDLAQQCRVLAPNYRLNLHLLGDLLDRLADHERRQSTSALIRYQKSKNAGHLAVAQRAEQAFQEHRDEAATVYLEALQLSPRNARTRIDIGTHFHRHGDWSAAGSYYRSAKGTMAVSNYTRLVDRRIQKLAKDQLEASIRSGARIP